MDAKHVEASQVIDAPPEAVYAVLSDYKVGHPAILPKQFSNLTVEKGGKGEGTIIHFTVTVFGQQSHYRQAVSEPEPGRVLVETDLDIAGQVTKFVFEPLQGGQQTHLTISTEYPVKPGFQGWMESLMLPPIASRMYQEELGLIAEYVGKQKSAE